MNLIRGVIIAIGLIVIWQLAVWGFAFPSYILPGPKLALLSLIHNAGLIAHQAVPTIIETLLGLLFGSLLGISTALSMIFFKPVKHWFLPILLISQALPTFAIAPLFIVWFGYGMASKIAITILMLFFPVASAFYDGLRKVPNSYLELAKTLNCSRWQLLWRIQVPSALPSLATGLRVAATIAPIGAVIGEWVGSSQGLGFLLLNANARMQISLMFAVLLVITVFTLLLYFIVDKGLSRVIDW
jgi:putative hydroxymethylpyrimidine transport system permease protein